MGEKWLLLQSHTILFDRFSNTSFPRRNTQVHFGVRQPAPLHEQAQVGGVTRRWQEISKVPSIGGVLLAELVGR